ncbi:carboxymuconolactone decarboxylase [Betaproteobacteria bacterium GR16-43]|nr:carboxymuconolactone decarboxylase [Betaproteobacteria bacterium GR16-43]
MKERLPMLADSQMNDVQKKAAAELIAGPRKAVIGPFIALMRSPELMDRLQKVGEYLRFGSTVPPKLNEFAMCIVARHVTNQFEWVVHYPNALKAGVAQATLDAIGDGRQPSGMPADEALVHDFVTELLRTHGVCDATYARTVEALGEQGLLDLIGLVGYFIAICLVMNVAHTPAPSNGTAELAPLPM